jgi:hypothetical protein
MREPNAECARLHRVRFYFRVLAFGERAGFVQYGRVDVNPAAIVQQRSQLQTLKLVAVVSNETGKTHGVADYTLTMVVCGAIDAGEDLRKCREPRAPA